MKKIQHFSSTLFLMIGLILLFILIRRFGYHDLMAMFTQLGPKVWYVLALPLVWYFFQTFAWYVALEETGDHISLIQLLMIRLAGETVNTLTPVSFIGGDPVRIYMLQKQMPGTLSTASVVLDRTIQSLAVVLFVILGLVVAWHSLDLPFQWKLIFPLLTLSMVFLVWFFMHRQQKGLFNFLSKVLQSLGIRKHLSESIQEKIKSLDERIAHFYRHDPKRFRLVLFFHFLGRLVGVFEIYIIARFFSIPLGITGSLFLASLTVLINMVFVFIPGSMGVMEGAYGAIFHLMNLDPITGIAIQLVRRLRTVFWILIGLMVMVVYQKTVGARFIAPRN